MHIGVYMSIPISQFITHTHPRTVLLRDNLLTIKFTNLKCTIQWILVYFQFFEHHHKLIQEYFYHPKRNFFPLAVTDHPPSHPRHYRSIYFMSLWVFPFWIFHIKRITQYIAFCGWFISLCIIFSMSVNVVAYVSISFLLLPNNSPLCEYTTFVYPFR